MAQAHPNYKNILIIHFGQLGDVVLGLPAFRAIRERFPDAHITALVGKVPDQVVRLSGLADEVIMVDRVDLRDGPKLRSIAKIFKLTRTVRSRNIDLLIDLHSLSETNVLAFLSKAKHRLLANRESRSLDRLSNFRPKPPLEDKAKHLSERYIDVLRPLGISGPAGTFLLRGSADDSAFVTTKLEASDSKTVGLFPGAGHPSRCWPLEKFAALAERLFAKDLRPAVFLGPEEAGMREKVAEIFPQGTVIIDGLSIPQFIAATARLDAFVTNDTGPMHLAACAGAPIILLLDEQAPMTYLPLTNEISIIRSGNIAEITVDETYAATLQQLGNDKSHGA